MCLPGACRVLLCSSAGYSFAGFSSTAAHTANGPEDMMQVVSGYAHNICCCCLQFYQMSTPYMPWVVQAAKPSFLPVLLLLMAVPDLIHSSVLAPFPRSLLCLLRASAVKFC